MRLGSRSVASIALTAGSALVAALTISVTVASQAPAAGQAPGGAGGRGARGGGAGGGVAPALFSAADVNKDALLTRAELMGTMERWYGEADQPRGGSVTSDQLTTVLATAFPAPAAPAGGGRGAGPASLP